MNKSTIWRGALALFFALFLSACGSSGGGGSVATYTIGGSVSGLSGSGLVLQNNAGDDLAISGNGSFTFATAINDGSAYSVSVVTQPGSPNQTCSVTNGSGTLAGANIANVTVSCVTTTTYTIGGSVSGFAGLGLTLQNNSGDDLAISGNGSFTFDTAIADGSAYSVTVLSQPAFPGQTCTVTNAGGTLTGADITDITVFCPQAAVTPTVTSTEPKVLTFSWNGVGSDHYRLMKNPDGASGYTQVGSDTALTSMDETISVHIQDWVNASYIVQSCDVADNCTDSAVITTTSAMLDVIGYFKASNTNGNDRFGYSVSLSADGHTLAVAAHFEDSGASGSGLPGDTAGTDAINSGAVYVFTNAGGNWLQQTFLKADNAGADDRFGYSLSLSGDGNTLAVGATNEDGADDGLTDNAGATYVFARSGSTWSQQAYLTASMAEAADQFGYAVSLSTDGNTLAVGVPYDDKHAGGSDNGLTDDAGAVYMFTRAVTTWTWQAYLKASNAEAADWFGSALSLSGDGLVLAVGAYGEDSNAVGSDGNGADNSAGDSGAVYMFHYGSSWSPQEQVYLKASNTESMDWFGYAVSLNADGSRLAVGAYGEDSNATGINGDETDNSVQVSGAVYLFYYNASSSDWVKNAYLKASTTDQSDFFGRSVSLGADWTVAVGAYGEGSNATGINGDGTDNSAQDSGAVYLFRFNASTVIMEQIAYIKASNTGINDQFGYETAVSLSADGETLAVGAHLEDGAATGIGGDRADNSATSAGAVYLY